MKTFRESEAIKIYVLPEKEDTYTWKVEPPASLQVIEKKLPFYGEHGFWLKNWDQLRLWIEDVSRRKLVKQKEEKLLKSGVSDREYYCKNCKKRAYIRRNEDGVWICENCGAEVLWGSFGAWAE